MKKVLFAALLFVLMITGVYLLFFKNRYPLHLLSHSLSVGDSLDSQNGIIVYNNGMDYSRSHGKHYNKDSSFYYGKKWQCVEFIKRYYHDYLHFTMPDGMGHAKDFYDPKVNSGELNKQRGMIQYTNGSNEPPKTNDILVFGGKYGHVAIVTKVNSDNIEIIQQNIFMTPRESLPLQNHKGLYTVGKKKIPNGWLRISTQ
jgi:surface antigen